MQPVKYTSIDTILSKLSRETNNMDFNESDAIEWIGEALSELNVHEVQQEAVAFIEVQNYTATLPDGLISILQIAKNNHWSKEENKCCPCPEEVVEEAQTCDINCPQDHPANLCGYPVPLDCNGTPLTDYEVAYYRPYFDLQYEYYGWTNSNYYQEHYTPVRLSNHTFFDSIVCKEKDMSVYCPGCTPFEYSPVKGAEDTLRFNFEEGSVAISYLRTATDIDTGYPLVPDNFSYLNAVTAYVKWKWAASMAFSGREGYLQQSQLYNQEWLKYARQAKNYMKMPKSIDQYQNLLEQQFYLIPRHRRYYGFFGKLGREEDRRFNGPGRRRFNNW